MIRSRIVSSFFRLFFDFEYPYIYNDNYNDALTAFCHTSRLLPHVNHHHHHVLMRSTTLKSTNYKNSTIDNRYEYIIYIRTLIHQHTQPYTHTHTHTHHILYILCKTKISGCMNKQRMMFKSFTNTVVDHAK